MDLRLEVITVKQDAIPLTRLQELNQLLGGKDGPRKDLTPSARWVYRTSDLFLRPEHSLHVWEKNSSVCQLILWQDDRIVGELYGLLYPRRAVVGGIHSNLPLGGTHLMRHFARLAGARPITLRSLEGALGFYLKLGLRDQATEPGAHPMVWPLVAQRQAAKLALDTPAF